MYKIFLLIFFLSAPVNAEETIFSMKPKELWVLESENAFVLEDKYPQAPVHLLVISKQIIKSINEAPVGLLEEMLNLAKEAARKYGIYDSGYRIVINTNPEGGQSIYHIHIHVLGGRQMEWPPG
jgi:histidine triad (HIT) family protein